MHCLGAVSSSGESGSPNGGGGISSRGGVTSVVGALGVLVCEGRIRGPPRGYKEGPHCAAPLQTPPSDHKCEKDNYLCGRYLVLVREIAERINIGYSLCVEVLMCSDCPCGLARATCKDPLLFGNSSNGILSSWQQPSDILLEYWSIGVVPSKNPEMMNPQGLYQAVRSRLHFSQVAAWWSRSNGTKPNYVTTRVVQYNVDNLRKFRESPIEHTFPLAGIGDGNSIKVTVWALPRMEEVPTLNCPLHPVKDNEEECVARALTPTKNGPLASSSSHATEALVLPVLVDDRLQTTCDKPGKHHCHCEDDDASCPPSLSIRPTGERKRRRSLPCGPSDTSGSSSSSSSSYSSVLLPSVQETRMVEPCGGATSSSSSSTSSSSGNNFVRYTENPLYNVRSDSTLSLSNDNRSYITSGSLERNFHTQVSLDDDEENEEKRYKPSTENLEIIEKNSFVNDEKSLENNSQYFSISNEIVRNNNRGNTTDVINRIRPRETNLVINPLANCYNEANPGPSSYIYETRRVTNSTTPPCTVHQNYSRGNVTTTTTKPKDVDNKVVRDDVMKNCIAAGKDLTQLMSKLTFPKDKIVKNNQDQGGILEWFTRVPGRVIAVPATVSSNEKTSTSEDNSSSREINNSEVKMKNCNLELSQREFNEVLAVLRSRTPSVRRKTPVKTIKRRSEKSIEDRTDDSCVCPIHREIKRNTDNNCVCRYCQKFDDTLTNDGRTATNDQVFRCQSEFTVKNDDKNSSKTTLQNVSNKADVLLGAILRTRERKGLSDISNGTKPRTTVDKYNNRDDDCGASPKNSRIISSEDDKSLPSVINKRLNRFKQLFKKDSDKRDVSVDYTVDNRSSEDDGNRKNLRENRVKRKIDFTNIYAGLTGDETVNYEELVNGAISETHVNNPAIFETPNCGRDMNRKNRDESLAHSTIYAGKTRKNKDTVGNDYEDDETIEKGVPSAIEQEQFRRSLENAASMVFHSRTGLPLTSSPAPLRRGSCCFDYDSSLNSVSSKRSALFELNTPPSPGAVSLEETDREIENCCEGEEVQKRASTPRSRPQSHALLGSFEESALNGRLEPVSTVHGFTAELGASGTFCPKHRKLPVTVFFYTLGDNDKVSTPYLAHINLGKKGYQVPRSGTIQVTLLNPLGTVVKMFVVLYDLSDMPPRSHTFLRQRTLRDKTLRYLVHLRFMSGKSGRIYLHTDIRMIICRKSDVDTASDFGSEPPKELRSYIHGPTNPKFSPRC